MLVCLNGELVDSQAARISVFDHGLLYGDGVFDTIAAVGGKIYWLEEHVDRLLEGCQILKIRIPWTREMLAGWTHQVFEAAQAATARLRLTITRGVGDVPIYAAEQCRPTLIIFATPLDLPDESLYRRGLRLRTTRLARVCPRAKTLSFLPSVIGFLDARAAGGDDTLFANDQGFVLEGATFNICAVRGETILTPDTGILMGVTRAKVLQLARSAGYVVVERNVTLDELLNADEAFVVSTTKRVAPVSSVDDQVLGAGTPGPVTTTLLDRFRATYF